MTRQSWTRLRLAVVVVCTGIILMCLAGILLPNQDQDQVIDQVVAQTTTTTKKTTTTTTPPTTTTVVEVAVLPKVSTRIPPVAEAEVDPTPAPEQDPNDHEYVPDPDIGEVEAYIRQVWTEAGYGWEVEFAVRVARCESGLRPEAISRSGKYHGVFQIGWDASSGIPVEQLYNYRYNIETAIDMRIDHGWGRWECA